jgi:hypothetical protein
MIEAVPVLARVEERERPARRGGGHVDPEHVFQRHREDVAPRWILRLVFLQLVLGREGQPAEVVQRADGRRLDRGGPELAPVERTVRRRVGHLFAKASCLHPRHLGAGCTLQTRLEVAGGHPASGQAVVSSSLIRLKN